LLNRLIAGRSGIGPYQAGLFAEPPCQGGADLIYYTNNLESGANRFHGRWRGAAARRYGQNPV